MSEVHSHRRSSSGQHHHIDRSQSPPSQTFHPSILPKSVPTPALVGSVASGAHYSGANVDPDATTRRRSSDRHSRSLNDVQEGHKSIMKDLKELYECRPTVEILKRSWHENGVFEDPLVCAYGYSEYAPQWFALPKLFSKSEQLSSRIMSSTHSPNRLVYSQKQEYTFKLFGTKKVIDSIVTVDLDENNRILHMADKWNGNDPPTRFGAGFLRRANGKVTSWLVRIPKV